ncbi:DUF2787 domain-containing protein [Vibrio fluvialis]|nr:DUF2787 domain-containing protein [Vibrio fluvialis]
MLDFSLHTAKLHPSTDLVALLSKHVANDGTTVLNFRDPNYTAESGGYCPVEIGIEVKEGKAKLLYLTDFTYVKFDGFVKGVDFSFEHGVFSIGYGDLPMVGQDVKAFWELYTRNFVSYVNSGGLLLDECETY